MNKIFISLLLGIVIFFVFKISYDFFNVTCFALTPECMEKTSVESIMDMLNNLIIIWLPLLMFGLYKFLSKTKNVKR